MLLSAADACFLVVDIQDKLLPAVRHQDAVVANTRVLLQAARALGVPVLASEQYPRGIGSTVAPVAELLPDGSVVEKLHFSCLADPGFARRFAALGRSQAVVCGLEAHVCVLQTVEQILSAGHEAFVVADAVSSRAEASHALALRRLEADGARIVTTEMVVFEWLGQAGTPVFRELSRLIK
ncbi:MAG: hydrolase [Rhodospirillales bacterium]|jgi:nicotinamidase-related amidase|nr:hydrolase [Rhodospirillales bacterium]